MPASRPQGKSAFGAGVSQFAVSIAAFGALTVAAIGGVQLFGDQAAAAPKVHVALFQPKPGAAPYIKPRISNSSEIADAYAHAGDPSLAGVEEYEGGDGEGDGGDSAPRTIVISDVDTPAGVAMPGTTPLAKAPILGFFEKSPAGDLPRISPEGRTPAEAYARPFTPNGAPRVSLIVGGLGLKAQNTLQAINELPAEVTLSFVPYANDLQTWINRARAAGHEVLLELPMEPYDYPTIDTGPHTLLTSASSDENIRRLNLLLGKATGYFGVTNYQGAKFATEATAAKPVFDALKSRGLVFMHDGAAARSALPDAAKAAGIGFRVADRITDSEPSAEAIDRQLLQIEALALQNGAAVGMGYAYPVTIDQFNAWASGLKAKGYQLVPASAAAGVRAMSAGSVSPAPAARAAAPAAAHAPAAAKH